MRKLSKLFIFLLFIVIVIVIIAAMQFPSPTPYSGPGDDGPEVPPVYVTFEKPYAFNKEGVENGNKVFVGRSTDYGQTWEYWNITPFKAFMDYPTINGGPDGSVAVAFYATETLPVSDESEWYLYGAMQLNADMGELNLNFSIADPTPCYVGVDLHALHDFFEIVISPDMALNIGYQYYIGPENGRSDMYFVRGTIEEN